MAFRDKSKAPFDLADIGFVKRIVVGNVDPEKFATNEESEAQMALLNRCLTEFPKGRVLGMEKTFSILSIGEHQVVLQAMIYHVGFTRRPDWLGE